MKVSLDTKRLDCVRGDVGASGSADVDVCEAEGWSHDGIVWVGIVANFDEVLPEFIEVAGDIHFRDGHGEFAIFDGVPDEPVGEIAPDGIAVAAQQIHDENAVIDACNNFFFGF